jgi:hypothetical protein
MKTKIGYQRIKAAQKENERWILKRIKLNGIWSPGMGLTSIQLWNALDRLRAKKKIRYSIVKGGYVLK